MKPYLKITPQRGQYTWLLQLENGTPVVGTANTEDTAIQKAYNVLTRNEPHTPIPIYPEICLIKAAGQSLWAYQIHELNIDSPMTYSTPQAAHIAALDSIHNHRTLPETEIAYDLFDIDEQREYLFQLDLDFRVENPSEELDDLLRNGFTGYSKMSPKQIGILWQTEIINIDEDIRLYDASERRSLPMYYYFTSK